MKWIYKLCYWILRSQRKPMFINIHTERIQTFKNEVWYTEYYIRQFGMETVDEIFLKESIHRLVKSGLLKIEKEPANRDFPGNHVKYSVTIKILQ